MIELNLTSDPHQTFSQSVNGIVYDFEITLNNRDNPPQWKISISQAGLSLVRGVSLVGGVDLFDQYPDVPIDNAYVLNLEDVSLDPSEEGLGITSGVFVLTDEEVASLG